MSKFFGGRSDSDSSSESESSSDEEIQVNDDDMKRFKKLNHDVVRFRRSHSRGSIQQPSSSLMTRLMRREW